MSLTLPQWKEKIVLALKTILIEEGPATLNRWLLPYLRTYVVARPCKEWPRQQTKFGGRRLLLKFLKELTAAIPASELANYVEACTQDEAICRNQIDHSNVIWNSLNLNSFNPPTPSLSVCSPQLEAVPIRKTIRKKSKKKSVPFVFEPRSLGSFSPTDSNEQLGSLDPNVGFARQNCSSVECRGGVCKEINAESQEVSMKVGFEGTTVFGSDGTTNSIMVPGDIDQASSLPCPPLPTQSLVSRTDPSRITQNQELTCIDQQESINFCEGDSEQCFASSSIVSGKSSTVSAGSCVTDDPSDDDDDWSDLSDKDADGNEFNASLTSLKLVRRRRIVLKKFCDHSDMPRLEKELEYFFRFQCARTSETLLKQLGTTLRRFLFHYSSSHNLHQLSNLDYAVDAALRDPRVVGPYITSYSVQTSVASSIRNEVNRMRDLIKWRTSLLLIGSSDDLSRRQLGEMESFLGRLQSKLQGMVSVRTPAELEQIRMWSSISDLRKAVLSQLALFQSRLSSEPTFSPEVEDCLSYQKAVISYLYTGMRPMRRQIWRSLTLTQLSNGPTLTFNDFKTSKTHRFMCFTIPDDVWKALQLWVQFYRPILAKGFETPSPYVFVTKSGGMRSISSDVGDFFYKALKLFICPTRIRQIYRTEIHGRLNESERNLLDSSDGHLPITVRKHYLKLNKEEEAKQADALYSKHFPKQ